MQGSEDNEVGYKKPPKHSRFQKGQSGNPKGKTSETKRMELANAEAAMRIRARALKAVEAKLEECSTEEAIEMLVEAAMLKLIKDSEDRGLGSPVQAVDHTTNGKDIVRDPREMTDKELARIVAAANGKPS